MKNSIFDLVLQWKLILFIPKFLKTRIIKFSPAVLDNRLEMSVMPQPRFFQGSQFTNG